MHKNSFFPASLILPDISLRVNSIHNCFFPYPTLAFDFLVTHFIPSNTIICKRTEVKVFGLMLSYFSSL